MSFDDSQGLKKSNVNITSTLLRSIDFVKKTPSFPFETEAEEVLSGKQLQLIEDRLSVKP